MPIHEFRCNSCQHTFELLIMNKDELSEVRCPKCQSPEVGKLMSAANISTGSGSNRGKASGPQVTSHTCSTGSCTSFTLPGHER